MLERLDVSYFDDADRANMLWEIDWESAKAAIQDWVREVAGS